MRDFNQNNRGGGHSGRRFNDRNSGPRAMHKATCSNCGKDCEVPFRPTGQKPVFCSECFSERGGNSNRRYSDRDNRDNRSYGAPQRSAGPDYQGQFDQLNQKLDTLIDLLSPKKKPAKKKVAPAAKAKAKKEKVTK